MTNNIKLACRLDDIMRLKPFVSTEETRYYLNGVRFEQGLEGVLLVATDGHRIGVFNAEAALCNGDGIVKLPPRLPKIEKGFNAWLIVGEFAKTEIALIMQFKAATTAQEVAENASLHNALAMFPRPLIDGTYPAWRRVIPVDLGKAGGCFNSAYLADYAKAANSKKGAPITLYGDDPVSPYVVTVGGEKNFIGVQMPMRGEILPGFPAWLAEVKPAKKAKAA